MKKIFSFITIALVALAAMSSCKKSTEGVTGITYYPVIEILGENPVIVPVGSTYVDAGCKVTLNGEDVTADAIVSVDVDTDEFGIYSVTYSAVNKDGFYATAVRDVYVTNPGHFDNLYFGYSQFGTRKYSGAPVIIKSLGGDKYSIDDVLCGFYWFGRYPGYEPTYDFHAEGIITLNSDNTITLDSVGSWQWGDDPITYNSAVYDPAEGTVEFDIDFAGDPFYAALTEVK